MKKPKVKKDKSFDEMMARIKKSHDKETARMFGKDRERGEAAWDSIISREWR